MQRVLHLVTDLSFAGGDHVFVLKLLKHLSEHYPGDFELHVGEVCDHAAGHELGVYDELRQLGVKLHSIAPGPHNYLEFKMPCFIADVVRRERIDIVHSHIFVADLATAIARVGSRAFLDLLAADPLSARFDILDEIVQSRITDLSEIYLDMLPARGLAGAGAVEPTDVQWVSTKHLGALKSVCQEADLEVFYAGDADRRAAGHRLNRFLQATVSRIADKVVTISDYATELWRDIIPAPQYIPVAVIGDAVWDAVDRAAAERDRVRKAHRVGGLLFCFVGRLARKKNPLLLIEAFLEHHRRHPDDRLIVVGDGRLRDKCRARAGECEAVIFAGHLPPEGVFQTLAGVDALCLFSNEEGLPLVVQEALASSVPVLASRAGGIPDLVADGDSGLLVDAVDRQAIEATLARFAGMAEEARGRMRRSARTAISSWYSDADAFKAYVALYRSQPSHAL